MTLKYSSNVLLDPVTDGGGGTATTLSPEQQKVAAALSKAAAAEPPPKGPVRRGPVRPITGEPPKNIIEGADFGIGPDEATPEGLDPIVVDPTPKKVEPPVVVKKDDTTPPTTSKAPAATDGQIKIPTKAAAEGVTPVVVPTTPPATTKDGQRDYTGYTVEETALLKQMSKPAFEFTTKQMRLVKELQQKGGPEAFYQHPDAYVLTSEYQEAGERIGLISKEAAHWRQQLVNVRNGKPWQVLAGFDEKGNPVLGDPLKATDEAEIDIQNALSLVSTEANKANAHRQMIQQTFKQRVEQDTTQLMQVQAKQFEWVADPKKEDEKLSIPGVGDVPIKQIKNDFKSLFASYHRNSPVLELASNMWVALQIYGTKIRDLEQGKATEKGLKEEVIRGEPTLEGATGGGAGEGRNGEFSMEGLPE